MGGDGGGGVGGFVGGRGVYHFTWDFGEEEVVDWS